MEMTMNEVKNRLINEGTSPSFCTVFLEGQSVESFHGEDWSKEDFINHFILPKPEVEEDEEDMFFELSNKILEDLSEKFISVYSDQKKSEWAIIKVGAEASESDLDLVKTTFKDVKTYLFEDGQVIDW